jgi:hypothetical protein
MAGDNRNPNEKQAGKHDHDKNNQMPGQRGEDKFGQDRSHEDANRQQGRQNQGQKNPGSGAMPKR